MEIRDRIKVIMENENLPSGLFADSIGVQQSTLSHILNGRNKPSLDVIMKIHQKYNYINLDWLLYGNGDFADISTSENKGIFPSLFDENPKITPDRQEEKKYRQEMPLETPKSQQQPPVIQEIKYIERPSRKITEIRIFFDDNTYETFKSEK